MSTFDTIMSRSGLPAFQRMLGDPVRYTPVGGGEFPTWGIFARGSVVVGEYGERQELRDSVELPVSDVPAPQPGDRLQISGKTYCVDRVSSNNGLFVTVVLR